MAPGVGSGIIQNPIAHLDKTRPPEKKLSREQKAIARRVAKFEASRQQEEPMAAPKMVMQDMNPGVPVQTKLKEVPRSPGTPPRPPNPAVQRVARPQEAPVETGPDLMAELEAELMPKEMPVDTATTETGTAQATETDPDIETILKRYKGDDAAVKRELAKSYANAEKRMRQLENEKKLLMSGQPVQTATNAPAAVPNAAPAMTQTTVIPQFDYKKWGERFLDAPDERAKEFENHIRTANEQQLVQVVAPLFEEVMNLRLMNRFPEVVNPENLDVIKAMAHTEPGANKWEQLVGAVNKYSTSMKPVPPIQTENTAAMREAVQTPTPQAKTGEKKMWKESVLQATLQQKIRSGEYQRDPRWRNLVDAAYRDGRVLKGQ